MRRTKQMRQADPPMTMPAMAPPDSVEELPLLTVPPLDPVAPVFPVVAAADDPIGLNGTRVLRTAPAASWET